MKKKLLATLLAISMLIAPMSVASAKSVPIPWWELLKLAYDLWKDHDSGTQCATEYSDSGNEVLICMPGGGCQWVSGSAVHWGGSC